MTDPFAAPQGQQYAPPQQPAFQPPPPAPGFPPQGQPQQGAFQQYQPAEMNPNPGTPAPSTDTSGFFAGGGASISFKDSYWMGKPRGGQVIAKRMGVQRDMDGKARKWDDGNERQQAILTLQTNERIAPDDDGKRDLFVKSGMVAAVRKAIQEAGVNDVEIGGWLYVAWVDNKPTTKGNPMKLFSAQYTRLGSPPPALASQPVQMPATQAPPAPPVPQPGQGADQFAAYAAWQAQQTAQGQQPAAAVPPMTGQQAAGVFGAPAQQQPGQPVANPFG